MTKITLLTFLVLGYLIGNQTFAIYCTQTQINNLDPSCDGHCGSLEGIAYTSSTIAPTGDYCGASSSYAYDMTYNSSLFRWEWTCESIRGGSDASCATAENISNVCDGDTIASVVNPINCSYVRGVGVPVGPHPLPSVLHLTGGTCNDYIEDTWDYGSTYVGLGDRSIVINGVSCNTTTVNGICGSINNTTVGSVPTANLCSQGTSSFVFGAGPYIWTCQGLNGGTTASCNAQATPIVSTTSTQIRDVNCVSSNGAIVDPSFCTGTIPANTQTVAREVCNATTGTTNPIICSKCKQIFTSGPQTCGSAGSSSQSVCEAIQGKPGPSDPIQDICQWDETACTTNGNTYTCQNGAWSSAGSTCSPASAPISYDIYMGPGGQDFINGDTQCATSAPNSNCNCFNVTNTSQIGSLGNARC